MLSTCPWSSASNWLTECARSKSRNTQYTWQDHIYRTPCFTAQSKYRHIPSCLLSLYLYCVNEAAYSKSVPLVTSLTIHEHAFVQEQPCAPYTCPSLPSFPLSPLPFQLLSCWVSFHFYYFRHRVFWLIFFNNPVVFCQYLLRSASSDFISRCLLFYVLRLWLTPSDRQGFLNQPFNRRQL